MRVPLSHTNLVSTRIATAKTASDHEAIAKEYEKEAADTQAQYEKHQAGVSTFITRLAENPNVSEETIRALAGHVSKRMLERYSHIRLAAKEAAIAGLERPTPTLTTPQLARSADVLDHSPEAPTVARRDR